MNRKVEQALKTMVRPGDHVICAVSGGKDSMAMLHVLLALQKKLDIQVTAAHLNHQLRGEESQRDASFVTDYCQSHGIPVKIGVAHVAGYAREKGLGIEEAARTLRYEFLQALEPGAKIATAHTAEDNLETVLMHLIRGTTLHGLAGIPPVREHGKIIRPLLTVSRAELAKYLEDNHIPHVEDSTNALDDGLRNRIRHHVLPLLTAENPDLAASMAQLTASLRREDDYLEQEAARFQDRYLDVDQLLSLHEAIQYRVLRQYLGHVPNLTGAHLEAALALCRSESPSARLSLPGNHTLSRVYGSLQLWHDDPLPPPGEVALRPGEYQFGTWHVTCRMGTVPEVLPPNTLALKPREGLCLRTRCPGDRISLPAGTKKVSRYLIDIKVPAHLRDTLPVVASGDTVLAVLPLQIANNQRAAVGSIGLMLTAVRMEDVE